MPIAAERRSQVRSKFGRHEKDSGSPEVQVALLTDRIKEVSVHLKEHEKDFHSRRGLVMMVGKRNRLLKYLAQQDPKGYQKLIGSLGLRK